MGDLTTLHAFGAHHHVNSPIGEVLESFILFHCEDASTAHPTGLYGTEYRGIRDTDAE